MFNKTNEEFVDTLMQISTKCFDDVEECLNNTGLSKEMDLQRWCYSFFHIASFTELMMVSQAIDRGAKGTSFNEVGEVAFERYLEFINANKKRFNVGEVNKDEIRHFGKIIFGQMFDSNEPIVKELVFKDQKYGQKLLLAAIAAVYIPGRDLGGVHN